MNQIKENGDKFKFLIFAGESEFDHIKSFHKSDGAVLVGVALKAHGHFLHDDLAFPRMNYSIQELKEYALRAQQKRRFWEDLSHAAGAAGVPLSSYAYDQGAHREEVPETTELVSAHHDDEALAGFQLMCRSEGIVPALESSHAVAYLQKLAPTMAKDDIILMNLSGRGDKDVRQVASIEGVEL